MRKETTYLLATPSFIRGMGRVLDINGSTNVYNANTNPDETAIESDWAAVWEDFKEVAKKHA